MAMARVWICLAIMLLAACCSIEASLFRRDRKIEFGGGKALVGGWSSVDPSDPDVVTLAKFAVREHNKKLTGHQKLYYSKVVEAKRQVVSGLMYLITVEAANRENSSRSSSSNLSSYQAKIWVKDWEKYRELVSFDPVTKS